MKFGLYTEGHFYIKIGFECFTKCIEATWRLAFIIVAFEKEWMKKVSINVLKTRQIHICNKDVEHVWLKEQKGYLDDSGKKKDYIHVKHCKR